MSSEPALEVHGLGKRYRIASAIQTATSMGEALGQWLRRPLRRREDVWALRDVSFSIGHGEAVGIMGRNGAGKSTLLKVLSRITPPTTGRAEIHGHTGSLLEVGTGFHPELTGRENIYLNGSILGMSRREIRARFDEIVAFAGVERFLEVPVKRYSSGMYVRLAFAVAAHLDPAVLIVDEVLAVGDVGFQARCLEKMRSVAREGRTVLFVSHNPSVVQALTERVLWLEDGGLRRDGPTDDVITEYLRFIQESVPWGVFEAPADDVGAVRRVEVLGDGGPKAALPMGAEIAFGIDFARDRTLDEPMVYVDIDSDSGERVVTLGTVFDGHASGPSTNAGRLVCRPRDLRLNQGRYRVTVALAESARENVVDKRIDACRFEVTPTDAFGSGRVPAVGQGVVWCGADWRWCTPTAARRVDDPALGGRRRG